MHVPPWFDFLIRRGCFKWVCVLFSVRLCPFLLSHFLTRGNQNASPCQSPGHPQHHQDCHLDVSYSSLVVFTPFALWWMMDLQGPMFYCSWKNSLGLGVFCTTQQWNILNKHPLLEKKVFFHIFFSLLSWIFLVAGKLQTLDYVQCVNMKRVFVLLYFHVLSTFLSFFQPLCQPSFQPTALSRPNVVLFVWAPEVHGSTAVWTTSISTNSGTFYHKWAQKDVTYVHKLHCKSLSGTDYFVFFTERFPLALQWEENKGNNEHCTTQTDYK